MGITNAIGNLMKPAPLKPKILDAETITKEYKYWRLRIFYSMYLGYVFFYFTRKSFTFAMPAMINDLGFSPQDLGLLSSILYIAYGVSKFTSGTLSDRCNPRYFMAIGLILTGFFNIFFGMSSSILLFSCFWGLNGWFQGWGWPPVAKQLTHWYGKKERGTWWSICSSSHNVGGWLITILGAVIAQYWGWRFAMYVPGIVCIGGGLFLLDRLRDTPQSLGLPPIEEYKKEQLSIAAKIKQAEEDAVAPLTAKQILVDHVLNNKYVWALAIAYFFVYVVRTAMNDWSMVYLVQAKGYPDTMAGITVSWFEVGGFLGTIFAGWGSDWFFKGKRVPYMIVCGIALIIAIPAFWYSPPGNIWLDSALIGSIGFFIFGPQMLAGLAAAELVNKKAAGTSNGFAGLFGYFGAAASGYPLGKIITEWGWHGFFVTLTICTVATMVILFPMWSVGDDSKTSAPKEGTADTDLAWDSEHTMEKAKA